MALWRQHVRFVRQLATSLGLASALASCGGPRALPLPPPPTALPPAPAPPLASAPANHGTRCEAAPTHEHGPLVLQVWVRTQGSTEGPLTNGDTLYSGDKLFLEACTSKSAYLYVLYCDTKRKLTLRPEMGPLKTPPGEPTRDLLGPGISGLNLDHNAGNETIYFLASERELHKADPTLSPLLNEKARGKVDCGPRLRKALVGKPQRLPWPSSPSHLAPRPPLPAPALQPTRTTAEGLLTADTLRQDADVVRGMSELTDQGVKASADQGGVVIVKFAFEHRER